MNMKRFLLSLVVATIAVCGYAQPKKTIISVAVAPESADWQYDCGENVKFNLSVLKAGVPLEDAEVYYEISEDMQDPLKKEKLTLKDACLMLGAMLIGCGPKAIYFLMLFPFLFIPKSKFESASQCKKYRWACVIVATVILLSFMLPFIFASDIKTDLRGGADVSAGGQVKFILTNPLEYTKILLTFMVEYLEPERALFHSVFYAYVGSPAIIFETIAIGLILFCTFVDKSRFAP